jgi:hypothetical protein
MSVCVFLLSTMSFVLLGMFVRPILWPIPNPLVHGTVTPLPIPSVPVVTPMPASILLNPGSSVSAQPPQSAPTQSASSNSKSTLTPITQGVLTPSQMLTNDERITPTYSDSLNNQSNPETVQEKWDTGTTTGTASNGQTFTGDCQFTSSGYEVSLSNADPQENNPSWCAANPPQPYTNALIEVSMTITSGNAGLLFRDQQYQGSSGNKWAYYFFDINPDAQPQPQFDVDVNPPNNQALQTSTSFSPSGSSHTYTLQVITQGSNMYVFIDRAYLAHVYNTTYADGGIGFACYNNAGGTGCNTVLSNVSVRNLSST